MSRYRLNYVESERGWGQKYESYIHDSYESALAALKLNLKNNPPGPAPDYYFIVRSVEEEVVTSTGLTTYVDVTKHFFDEAKK